MLIQKQMGVFDNANIDHNNPNETTVTLQQQSIAAKMDL